MQINSKQITLKLIIALLLILCSTPQLCAQVVDTLNNQEFVEPQSTTEVISLPLSKLEFQLSLCVLGFGLLLILLEIYLVRTQKIRSEDIIKFIIINRES